MDLGLRGRKALVTGASKGIGRACAEVLAEEGCDIVLVARTAADLETVRSGILAKHNVAVRIYPFDLSDSRNVDRLAAGTCRRFVCTVKFQGRTDHEAACRFAAIPGSQLRHLFHNKHELTWSKIG
jgi:NAD(P)-dependent dehydrogenase (short-subunit alcohol dehydrogenase family)